MPALDGSITGGDGIALVRPESVTVAAHGTPNATVSSVAFLGSISRVYCTLADGTVLSAQLPSAAAAPFSAGDAVTVGVEPNPVLVTPP